MSNKLEVAAHGYYVSNFCKPPSYIIEQDKNYLEVWEYSRCGNVEISVRGEDGTLYPAIALLLHYASEHQYKPPKNFSMLFYITGQFVQHKAADKMLNADLRFARSGCLAIAFNVRIRIGSS